MVVSFPQNYVFSRPPSRKKGKQVDMSGIKNISMIIINLLQKIE